MEKDKPKVDIQSVSVLGLAHVGDAVFELMVRTWLCETGVTSAKRLHMSAVEFVSAKGQATAFLRIRDKLTESEMAVYMRGRNAHASTIPKGATHEQYHIATGLETLFGYLHLQGETARLDELFFEIVTD